MADMQPFTNNDIVLDELGRRIETSGSQKAVAEGLGISSQHLGDILRGRRTASTTLLEKLGLTKIVVYVRINELPDVIRAINSTVKIDAGRKRSTHPGVKDS